MVEVQPLHFRISYEIFFKGAPLSFSEERKREEDTGREIEEGSISPLLLIGEDGKKEEKI